MLGYPLLPQLDETSLLPVPGSREPRKLLKTILTAIDYNKKGVSICIFPRKRCPQLRRIKSPPIPQRFLEDCRLDRLAHIPMSMTLIPSLSSRSSSLELRKTHRHTRTPGKPINPNDLDKGNPERFGRLLSEEYHSGINKNQALV